MSHRGETPSAKQAAARAAAADQRDLKADAREAALELRESLAESVIAVGQRDASAKVRRILDEADHRDDVSDARDAVADDREATTARDEFLDQRRGNGNDPMVRRDAALDRKHSRSDRILSKTDRDALAGGDDSTTPAN